MIKRIRKNLRIGFPGLDTPRVRLYERRPRGWHKAGSRSQKDLEGQRAQAAKYVCDMHEMLMLRGEFGSVVRFPRLTRHG